MVKSTSLRPEEVFKVTQYFHLLFFFLFFLSDMLIQTNMATYSKTSAIHEAFLHVFHTVGKMGAAGLIMQFN